MKIFILIISFLLLSSDPSLAKLPVKAALLYNMNTNKILYQKNPDFQIAPASLTKIMTMFLTLEAVKAKKLSLSQKIGISRHAALVGGSSMKLKAGEKVPVVKLMAGMAVISGNDAAVAVAEKVGKTEAGFIRKMNEKAKSLGMTSTKFKNPTGLPAAGQKTTARDLLTLCRAYLKSFPEAMRFHKMLYLVHNGAIARNTNPLLGVKQGVDGIKTGWTIASGYNLIVTAKRGNIRLIAIILGGMTKQDREAMASKLIEAGFQFPNNPKKVKNYIDS